MTNIKIRQAWQMALSLFNGVVKSGYGWRTQFQCGVSECSSIKSQFPCRVTCKHFLCDHFAKHYSWHKLPFVQLTNRIVRNLDTLRDNDWGITPFYLWIMCSAVANIAYAWCSQSLKSCRSCYYHSADWPIPSPIVIQLNGNLVSREMLIEFN